MSNEEILFLILGRVYSDLGEKSVGLAQEILAKYNLEKLPDRIRGYLVAPMGALLRRLERAEAGDLDIRDIDNELLQVVNQILKNAKKGRN